MNAVTPLEPDAARDEAWSLPLEDIDVSDPVLHKNDTIGFYFDRLREECPVHFGRTERFGDFWSVTRYKDIMAVDTNHAVYSSEPAITIRDVPSEFRRPNFITMDPPKHDHQRKAVSPIVAPANLARMESTSFARYDSVFTTAANASEAYHTPWTSAWQAETHLTPTLYEPAAVLLGMTQA